MIKRKKSEEIQEKIDQYKISEDQPQLNLGNFGFDIAIEIVSAAIVGVIVGLIFDYLFDSRPISIIICLMLSFVASFRLIYKKYIEK